MATFGTSNALQNGVRMMQEDHDNGARILATNAVKVLGEVLSELAVGRITLPYLWHSLCLAGWKLKGARPSMDAAIGGALVQTLMAIKEAWLVECKVDNNMLSEDFTTLNEQDLTKLKDIATSAIDLEIQRRVGDTRMARMFMLWLEKKVQELGERPVRILTLSCSSTMKKCLEVALREMPDFRIELRIMESRPLCEGAVLASSLSNVFHSDGDRNRLSIQVEPDSAVAILAKDVCTSPDPICPEDNVLREVEH
jgi:translation initiation factor 2B subunit (eIF-2B alpha/beta/delta family)